MVTDGQFGGYPRGKGTWEPRLWEWAIARYSPKTFADIGCGAGWAVRFFADAGIKSRGYDGSEKAIKNFYRDVQHYDPKKNGDQGLVILHDFEKAAIGNPSEYEMIWSAEFVEHVDEKFLPNILESLRAKTVLFLLHALPGQEGHHHVNCQPSEYWIEALKKIGMKFDEAASLESRKLSRFEGRGWGAKGLIFAP